VYKTRADQLGSYSVDLRNIESANLVATAQLVLNKFCTKQERLHEEVEKESRISPSSGRDQV